VQGEFAYYVATDESFNDEDDTLSERTPGLPGGSHGESQEITDYLAASHIAVVATINRHGHPHLTPNCIGTTARC